MINECEQWLMISCYMWVLGLYHALLAHPIWYMSFECCDPKVERSYLKRDIKTRFIFFVWSWGLREEDKHGKYGYLDEWNSCHTQSMIKYEGRSESMVHCWRLIKSNKRRFKKNCSTQNKKQIYVTIHTCKVTDLNMVGPRLVFKFQMA